jgi:hypothetical protein
MKKNNANNENNNSCPIKPMKIKTEKQALKKKVGSFYHPTSTTYRTGACPKGYELKESYNKKSYVKKNGTVVKGTHVGSVCVKDKGKPGKTISSAKILPSIKNKGLLEKYGYSTKSSSSERLKSLLKAAKDLSYRSVVARINLIRTLSESNEKLFNIYSKDLANMKKWRKENPDLYKKKK